MKRRNSYIENMYYIILIPAEVCSKRMSKGAKKVGAFVIAVLFSVFFLMHNSGFFFYQAPTSYRTQHIWGFLLMVLLCIFSIEKPLQHIRWDRAAIKMLLMCGVGLIITGVIHPIGDGYLTFGIMLTTVYPCLYYIWANRLDYEVLFDTFAKAQVLTGLIYFLYFAIMLLCGQTRAAETRQAGTMLNSNYFCTYGFCLMCSALYLIYRKRKRVKEIKGYLLLIVSVMIGLVVVMMGQSRASFLACILSIIAMIIFSLKTSCVTLEKFNGHGKLLIKIIVIITILWLIISLIVINSSDTTIFDRLTVGGKTADSFFAGRLTIWHRYAEKLNLIGNDCSIMNWEELTGNTVRHAHNNFLEYAYRCGIPVGLLFIAFHLYAGIRTIGFLFSRKHTDDCYLFVIFFVINYTLEAMLDVATMSMERYASFFFYLVVCVMFTDKKTRISKRRYIAGKGNECSRV